MTIGHKSKPHAAGPRCLIVSTCRMTEVLRGAEQQAVVLAAGLRRRGWAVRMAAPSGSRVSEAAARAELPLFSFAVRPEYSPWAFWRLHAEARRFHPDVLHLNDPHAVSLGVYARLFRTAPLIVAHRRLAKTPKSVWTYRLGADGLIVISEAVRQNMAAAGYPAGRMALAYSCVDRRYLACAIARGDARQRLRLPASSFVFLMAGAMVRQKDHGTLIRAFATFRDRPDALLLVAGDGSERPAIEALAREAGLGEHVRFTGTLEGDDLLCAYRAADVFVYATRFEGLGVATLEAQAMGVPVIASRVVGVTEAVVDAGTGLLVEAGNVGRMAEAMQRLRADDGLRAALGAAGPAWVRGRFSEGAMVEGVLAAYRRFGSEAAV